LPVVALRVLRAPCLWAYPRCFSSQVLTLDFLHFDVEFTKFLWHYFNNRYYLLEK
jgi:hypothetical protein